MHARSCTRTHACNPPPHPRAPIAALLRSFPSPKDPAAAGLCANRDPRGGGEVGEGGGLVLGEGWGCAHLHGLGVIGSKVKQHRCSTARLPPPAVAVPIEQRFPTRVLQQPPPCTPPQRSVGDGSITGHRISVLYHDVTYRFTPRFPLFLFSSSHLAGNAQPSALHPFPSTEDAPNPKVSHLLSKILYSLPTLSQHRADLLFPAAA